MRATSDRIKRKTPLEANDESEEIAEGGGRPSSSVDGGANGRFSDRRFAVRRDTSNRAIRPRGPNFAMQFGFLGALWYSNGSERLPDSAMAADVDSGERRAAVAEVARRRRVIQPPLDQERAFRRAQRRSLRVRILRKAILAGALGSVAAMVLIAIYNPFSPKVGALSFADVGLDGTKVAMASPRLAGFRSDGQAYTLTAERALQDIKRPTIVELQKLSGDIGDTDGESTHLSAEAGTYDNVAERMKLTNNVRIGNARYEVRLRSVDIDFKTGVYQSDEPVEVHIGDRATITGDRAIARHNGQEFDFEGHVRTTIVPAAEAGGKVVNP